jgi:predicted acetyltransferase
MPELSADSTDWIDVVAAPPERQATVENLLEFYAYDFSEYLELPVGEDGRFGYKYLSAYWTVEGRHPFLIERNGILAGVILVRRGSMITGDPNVWDMAEFFVMRRHRRRGVGATAARQIWLAHPGRWEVRVTSKNQPALTFWKRIIGEYVGQPIDPTQYDENGSEWNLFAFESPGAA